MKKTISLVLVLALGLVAKVANADFTFGTPTNLGPTVNSSAKDGSPSISADGLSLFFTSRRPGSLGRWDLWVTTRASISEPWGPPLNLGQTVNSSAMETEPSISTDGLSLYFADGVHFERVPRPGGFGQSDIWVAGRTTASDPWGTPVNLGPPVNTVAKEGGPTTTGDGLTLVFDSDRLGGSGGQDLWMTTRPTVSDPWSPPVNLGPSVNSSSVDAEPGISGDGLALFFMSNRTGDYDIWVTTRPSVSEHFGTPVNLGSSVNSSAIEAVPCISADGSTLFFLSQRPGGYGDSDLWQVSITPIVDLNGDGIVDAADMCIIVDNWHTENTLCDIAPAPLGDGFVDVQDLIVLAEHLFEEVDDPTLVAHWALDETEGIVAHDSAGYSDAYFIGSPLWLPSGGQVDGALQLDGVDDCVITASIPNPAEGPFGVFAWVKGGAPGQAVLSQMGGARWLCTDPLEGNLKTELKGTGRGANELLSQTIITDDNWHRIGLVWDGSRRTLYVDDIAVAEDTQTNLEGSENGLYIGAGTAMEPGSFWSGLIDDVRIYNRAVTP